MPNLFENGWRQGSVLRHRLVATYIDDPEPLEFPADVWMLVTQDCDLARAAASSENLVELRPVSEPRERETIDGIHSKTLIVSGRFRLVTQEPRLMITARKLDALSSDRENLSSDQERSELKTWLGLRYDRPAVPQRFTELAGALMEMLASNQPPVSIRDILVSFEDGTPPLVDFWIVLRNPSDRTTIQIWMDGFSHSMPNSLAVARDIQIEDSERTPFAIIERFYALDSAGLSATRDV